MGFLALEKDSLYVVFVWKKFFTENLQAAAYFLERPRIQEMFDTLDEIIILIGAIIHDVGHPGEYTRLSSCCR
jgi:3'5'-cyclic nucleotide phosphodiesterase